MHDRRDARTILTTALLDAPLEEVWSTWTTRSGLRSFFAPSCTVVPEPMGPFEVFDDPSGVVVGGEQNVVLAVEPETMLSFTWAPAPDSSIATHRTSVVVRLGRPDDELTLVTVQHAGFGDGPEWDVALSDARFMWNRSVLPRLRHRFQVGPVDWNDPPFASPVG